METLCIVVHEKSVPKIFVFIPHAISKVLRSKNRKCMSNRFEKKSHNTTHHCQITDQIKIHSFCFVLPERYKNDTCWTNLLHRGYNWNNSEKSKVRIQKLKILILCIISFVTNINIDMPSKCKPYLAIDIEVGAIGTV